MLYASFSKSGGLNTDRCMNNYKLRSTYKWVNNLFVRVRSEIYILTTCCSVLNFLFAVPKEYLLNTDRAWTIINVTINKRKEKKGEHRSCVEFLFVFRRNNTLTKIVCRRLKRMCGNN